LAKNANKQARREKNRIIAKKRKFNYLKNYNRQVRLTAKPGLDRKKKPKPLQGRDGQRRHQQ